MNYATHATPAGPFMVVADGDGVVHAGGWTTDPEALLALVAAPLRPAALRGRREVGAASRALEAYLAGDLAAVDAVPVRQASGPLVERQQTVHAELVKQKKRWRIVSITPLDFFEPAKFSQSK